MGKKSLYERLQKFEDSLFTAGVSFWQGTLLVVLALAGIILAAVHFNTYPPF